MHNSAFASRHVNAVLLPFPVNDLKDFLAALSEIRRERILRSPFHTNKRSSAHLDGCDPLAEKIGAVNTVVVRGEGELYGYNTDYVGILRALSSRVELRGSRVLLLGAGGAARAAAFALMEAGASVSICARRDAQSKALARDAGCKSISRSKVKREFFDAIVNSTPFGLRESDASPLRAEELNCRVVMDMIYRPTRTKLLKLAERRGIETVSGAEMFIAQGIAQWEIWMGERAPAEIMRRVRLNALKREEKRATN